MKILTDLEEIYKIRKRMFNGMIVTFLVNLLFAIIIYFGIIFMSFRVLAFLGLMIWLATTTIIFMINMRYQDLKACIILNGDLKEISKKKRKVSPQTPHKRKKNREKKIRR